MQIQTKEDLSAEIGKADERSKVNENIFSKDYVDFLSEVGWKLEKKLPSNSNNYSDLLEDTEWESNNNDFSFLKHYRRDLDALS
tara:strand:- start:1615 stop:1866 length:252 start_codon:yes stop_codon:yes gene_type:complete